MDIMGSCIGLLLALALIGVGASVVRKARPTSGYLFIAAGALELLIRCCRFATDPQRLYEHDLLRAYDEMRVMIIGVQLIAALEWLIVGVLLAVALAGLARDLRAT